LNASRLILSAILGDDVCVDGGMKGWMGMERGRVRRISQGEAEVEESDGNLRRCWDAVLIVYQVARG